MKVQYEFGALSDGRVPEVYSLQGVDGLRMDVTNYGGRVIRVYAPDRYGNFADVTLGWNTAAEYEKNGFCVGTLIGRYALEVQHAPDSPNHSEWPTTVLRPGEEFRSASEYRFVAE